MEVFGELEKRQRANELEHMELQQIADLGRRVFRGRQLQEWQQALEEQPRWIWNAEEPVSDDGTGLEDLELAEDTLRALQRYLSRIWRDQVSLAHPDLTFRQLGGRQAAFTKSLRNATWRETMQAAHRSLRAHGWRQWLEQVRATQAAARR